MITKIENVAMVELNRGDLVYKRYIGVLFLIPFLILILLGNIPLVLGILMVSLLALKEFYSAIKLKNYKPYDYIGYTMSVIYYILIALKIKSEFTIFIILLFIIIQFALLITSQEHNFIDILLTVFGFLYISIPFSFIVLISFKANGRYLFWLIFISAWSTDTFAYYIGKNFGKHKLLPLVSAKKTIEGSIAGILGSIILCSTYGIILNTYILKFPYPIYNFLIIGGIGGIVCQIGDLAASSIKRYVNIKDYSNIIPGHGGILDRFDSILFASVIVYYYIVFFMV